MHMESTQLIWTRHIIERAFQNMNECLFTGKYTFEQQQGKKKKQTKEAKYIGVLVRFNFWFETDAKCSNQGILLRQMPYIIYLHI